MARRQQCRAEAAATAPHRLRAQAPRGAAQLEEAPLQPPRVSPLIAYNKSQARAALQNQPLQLQSLPQAKTKLSHKLVVLKSQLEARHRSKRLPALPLARLSPAGAPLPRPLARQILKLPATSVRDQSLHHRRLVHRKRRLTIRGGRPRGRKRRRKSPSSGITNGSV